MRSLLFLLALVACSKQPAEPAARVTRVTEAAPPPAKAPPSPVDSTVVDAEAPPPATAEEPLAPKVKVISIGMHVAGGPYDEETKKPFLHAVEPHYPELAKCWRFVKEPRQADAGVDLLIPTSGGKPKVSHPRSTIAGEGFIPCVVSFFEGIEFEKPQNGGPQGLSYSVRFKP